MQEERQFLILCAQRPLRGAALGWTSLADEAIGPKPGSRDGPAYFAILTLFGL